MKVTVKLTKRLVAEMQKLNEDQPIESIVAYILARHSVTPLPRMDINTHLELVGRYLSTQTYRNRMLFEILHDTKLTEFYESLDLREALLFQVQVADLAKSLGVSVRDPGLQQFLYTRI